MWNYRLDWRSEERKRIEYRASKRRTDEDLERGRRFVHRCHAGSIRGSLGPSLALLYKSSLVTHATEGGGGEQREWHISPTQRSPRDSEFVTELDLTKLIQEHLSILSRITWRYKLGIKKLSNLQRMHIQNAIHRFLGTDRIAEYGKQRTTWSRTRYRRGLLLLETYWFQKQHWF